MKYNWNVKKTLEYLFSKKPDIEITDRILNGFNNIEQHLQTELETKPASNSPKKGRLHQDKELRSDWNIEWTDSIDTMKKQMPVLKEDEASLINTYKNS